MKDKKIYTIKRFSKCKLLMIKESHKFKQNNLKIRSRWNNLLNNVSEKNKRSLKPSDMSYNTSRKQNNLKINRKYNNLKYIYNNNTKRQ